MHLCRKTSHDGGYPAVELADALIQQTVGTVESGVRQERRAARHALARHDVRRHNIYCEGSNWFVSQRETAEQYHIMYVVKFQSSF